MKTLTHTACPLGRFRLCLFALYAGARFASAADVQSTWDGSTNFWHSTSNWSHSALSLLGYPSNSLQTYDVRIDAGEVTLQQSHRIDSLQLHGGHLALEAPLIVQSNFVWAGGDIDGGLSFNWPQRGEALEVRGGIQITGGAPRRLLNPLRTYGLSTIEGPVEIRHESDDGYWQNYGPLEIRGPLRLFREGTFGVLQSFAPVLKNGPGELCFDPGFHFESLGGLDVQSGTVRIRAEGFVGGEVQVRAGATLLLNSAWYVESNSVMGGEGLIRIEGASLGPYDAYGSNGFLFLDNARVEIHKSSLGQWNNPGFLLISSNSVVSIVGSNLSPHSLAGSVCGTNAGTVLIDAESRVTLMLKNNNALEFSSDIYVDGEVYNRGLMVKKGGTGVAHFGFNSSGPNGFQLINEGIIEVRVGTMFAQYVGTNYGTFIAAAGATNENRSGFSFATGSRFLGEGYHNLNGNIVGLITNHSHLNAGSLGGNGTLFNTPEGTLYVGIIQTTVLNEGTAIAARSQQYGWGMPYVYQSNFRNLAVFDWRDGQLAGAIHNDADIIKTSPSNFLVEAGTILSNRGAIHVQEGSVTFANAFTNTSTLRIASNAVVIVASNLVLAAGTQLEGIGSLVVTNGGNLVIAAALTNPFPTLIHGGTLTVLSDYTVGGGLILSEGTIVGLGRVVVASNAIASLMGTVQPGGAWTVQNGGALSIASQWPFTMPFLRDIENNGTLRLRESVSIDGAIVNRGLTESSGSIAGQASLLNEGHWLVHSNEMFVTDLPTVRFTNRGVLEVRGTLRVQNSSAPLVQESGELALAGGTLNANLDLLGGALTGTGTNSAMINSFSSISPGPVFGRLALTDLRMASGSSVTFDLGGTNIGSFDRIDVPWDVWCSNNVTFVVRLANGFTPQVGDQFEVMTFYWRSPFYGPIHYPSFRGLTLPDGLRLAPVLTYRSLILVATAAPPSQGNPLRLAREPFNSFRLHWPPEYAGFVLQHSTNLSSPWVTVRMTDLTSTLLWGGGEQSYFRLLNPEQQE